MAEPEVKKGSGIWIKLLLWGVVIVAGFLYLSAINDKQHEQGLSEESARTADSAAATGGTSALPADPATVPAAAAIPAAQPSFSQDKAPETPDSAPVTLSAPAISDIPPASPKVRVQTAPPPEPLGYPAAAPSVSDAPPAGPESAPVAAAPQAAPAAVPTVTTSPDRTGVTEPAAAGHQVQPQSEIAGSEGSQPTQSHLPQPPGTSPEPAQPRAEAPLAGPAAPAPGAGTPLGTAPESMRDRRARIMAEYEAMRQQRQDEMRRYWETMQRSRTPATGPYGAYPGYAPEYYRPW